MLRSIRKDDANSQAVKHTFIHSLSFRGLDYPISELSPSRSDTSLMVNMSRYAIFLQIKLTQNVLFTHRPMKWTSVYAWSLFRNVRGILGLYHFDHLLCKSSCYLFIFLPVVVYVRLFTVICVFIGASIYDDTGCQPILGLYGYTKHASFQIDTHFDKRVPLHVNEEK